MIPGGGAKTGGGGVLILSAAAGAGHVRAAEALASAFAAKGIAAKHVEVLEYASYLFKKVYSDLYIELVNHQPAILGLVYDALDHPWKYRKRRLALDWLNTRPLVRLLLSGNQTNSDSRFGHTPIIFVSRYRYFVNVSAEK